MRFAETYERNPAGAIVQYGYLLNTQWVARATFREEGFNVACSRTLCGEPSTD